jgi:hypothetical protein
MDQKITLEMMQTELRRGKYVILRGEKTGDITQEYLDRHFVGFVDKLPDGYALCLTLQQGEFARGEKPNIYTRLDHEQEEYVVVPNISSEDAEKIREFIGSQRMVREPPRP